MVRVFAVEELARLLPDELDQRGDAKRLANVVYVDDQHRDADENEQEGSQQRDSGHLARTVAVVDDLADGEDRMDERRDKEPDRELARLVSQDALHDARGELTHRQLDDDHRDREDERGETDHRACDGGEDHHGGIRPDDERSRKCLVVEVAVERDRSEGEEHAREHAKHRDEPEARLQMDENLGELHANRGLTLSPASETTSQSIWGSCASGRNLKPRKDAELEAAG